MQVDVRGLDAFVSEPKRDGGGVHASLEQLHRVGVAEDMWRDLLAVERRAAGGCVPGVLRDEPLDGIRAETGSAASRKEGVAGFPSTLPHPDLENGDRLSVQRCAAVLAALTLTADIGAASQMNVIDLQASKFSQTKASLNGQQQQSVVSPTVPGRTIGSREETDDLPVVEVRDVYSPRALVRDGEHALDVVGMLGVASRGVMPSRKLCRVGRRPIQRLCLKQAITMASYSA